MKLIKDLAKLALGLFFLAAFLAVGVALIPIIAVAVVPLAVAGVLAAFLVLLWNLVDASSKAIKGEVPPKGS